MFTRLYTDPHRMPEHFHHPERFASGHSPSPQLSALQATFPIPMQMEPLNSQIIECFVHACCVDVSGFLRFPPHTTFSRFHPCCSMNQHFTTFVLKESHVAQLPLSLICSKGDLTVVILPPPPECQGYTVCHHTQLMSFMHVEHATHQLSNISSPVKRYKNLLFREVLCSSKK